MNKSIQPMLAGLFAVSGLLGTSTYAADPPTSPQFFSAAELAARVDHPDNGAVAKEIAADPSATTMIIRRDKTGEVEVHTVINDTFVVERGHAWVTVGGIVTGNHEIRPTELRGGQISGGRTFELGPGDVLLIPAGLPHLVTLHSAEPFIYVTIKTPLAPPH